MKNTIRISFLTLLFMPVLASAAEICARCGDIKKLEQSFTKLQYASESDRAVGAEKMVKVSSHFERFYTTKKNNPARREEFRALVNLVGAALPYDEGGETVESLVNLIRESKELKAVYNQTAPAYVDRCRRQLLTTDVEQRNCYEDQFEAGQEEGVEAKCIRRPVFDYGACVGVKLEP